MDWTKKSGGDLLSHTVARAVPSAQRGLTTVFGMGTGDPSQYGHRQVVRGSEPQVLRRDRDSGLRLGADAPNMPQLWMALGRMVFPQPAAASVTPDCSARISTGNAACKLAPVKLCRARKKRARETKWIGIQGVKSIRCNCAELILWISQTGD